MTTNIENVNAKIKVEKIETYDEKLYIFNNCEGTKQICVNGLKMEIKEETNGENICEDDLKIEIKEETNGENICEDDLKIEIKEETNGENICEDDLKIEIKEETNGENICEDDLKMEIEETNGENICENDVLIKIKEETNGEIICANDLKVEIKEETNNDLLEVVKKEQKSIVDEMVSKKSKSPKKLAVKNVTFKTDENGKINFYMIKGCKRKLVGHETLVKNPPQSPILDLGENSFLKISQVTQTPKSNEISDVKLNSTDTSEKINDKENDIQWRKNLFDVIYDGSAPEFESPDKTWGFHRIEKNGKRSLVYTELGMFDKSAVPQIRKLVIFDENLNAEMYVYGKLLLRKEQYTNLSKSNAMFVLTLFLKHVHYSYNICKGAAPASEYANINPSYVVNDSSILRAKQCKILFTHHQGKVGNEFICKNCSEIEQRLKQHMQLLQE